jgi:hypothetical protein
MSQGFFCDSLVFISDIVQAFFTLFYAVWGIFGLETPLVDPPSGSLFGCNL